MTELMKRPLYNRAISAKRNSYIIDGEAAGPQDLGCALTIIKTALRERERERENVDMGYQSTASGIYWY